ncbi:MAG: T9SS type A sorting domain-containing protein [Chitinophagales bacterium]
MKKQLLTSLLGLAITGVVFAQENCPHDTVYNSKFVDGSTTQTPVSRIIYFDPEVNGGDGAIRSSIEQVFKNGSYVNSRKEEFVIHQPSGSYSEYLSSLWDSATAAWKPDYKAVFTFGSNNLWTEYYYQEKNQSGVLENVKKYTRTFNAKNIETNYITSVWNNGAWRNKSQSNRTYQADTLLLLYVAQNWDTAASAWVNGFKEERTFDAAGRETSYAQFNWDVNTNAWIGSFMQVATFNAQGFQTASEGLYWNAGTSSFRKSSRTLYTPNAAGKSTIDSVQTWNSVAGAYISHTVRLYTYNASNAMLTYRSLMVNASGVVTSNFLSTKTLDAGNRPLEIFEQDSSSAGNGLWRPYRRWTYTYNANGDKLTEKYELRQGSADTLSNVNRVTYTYNANNHLLTSVAETWNATTSAWVPSWGNLNEYNNDGKRVASESTNTWNATGNYFANHNRSEYVCKAIGVGIDEAMQSLVKIYPNPATTVLQVSSEEALLSIAIVDLFGRKVFTQAVNEAKQTQIDVSKMAASTYFIHLTTTNGNTAVKSFVKQ